MGTLESLLRRKAEKRQTGKVTPRTRPAEAAHMAVRREIEARGLLTPERPTSGPIDPAVFAG